LNVPTVVCLRGNDVDRDLACDRRGPLVAAAVRDATAVAAVARSMAATISERFAIAAHFIANSVDACVFHPDPAAGAAFGRRHALDDRPVLGVFGVFKPKRGLDRLARIATELARWQVLLVGAARADVRAQVAPTWRIVDFVEDDDQLRAAYNACDVVVQPSRRDGMPNTVLEAMACGRTVAGARVGGIPDVIDHDRTGLLFDTAGELAAQLRDLRTRPRPELGAAARVAVPTPAMERAAFETLFARAVTSR
jgi:glycosyltransferase involved in cell wall biosynthesis